MLRAQLRLEATLDPADLPATMWQAMVEFSGTSVTIGRGGVNTCFYTFGKGERKVDYPAKLISLLDRLAKQPYPFYHIVDSETKALYRLFSLERAKAVAPKYGWKIVGVDADSSKHPAFMGRRDLQGEYTWIPDVRRS